MEWQEPEVAVPVPAYTGQPMEEMPESARKRRRRGDGAAEEAALEATEKQLDSRLETGETERVRHESETRKSMRRSTRRSTRSVDYRERPPSPELAPEPEATAVSETKGTDQKKPRLRRNRRSAAGNPFSTLRKPSAKGANGEPEKPAKTKPKAEPEPEEEPNNDYCSACGGIGDFVCCESCPNSFHLLCVDPPMDEESLPDGAWYCNECNAKRAKSLSGNPNGNPNGNPSGSPSGKLTIRIKTEQGHEKTKKRRRRKKGDPEPEPEPEPTKPRQRKSQQTQDEVRAYQTRGLFGELMEQLKARNPQVFRLPQSLQYRFEGVVVGEEGEYVNEYQLPPKKPRIREENMRLVDQDDVPILCFKCSKTAASGPIITCDKCALPWHIDCLDPPQFNLPTRWVCPNHVEKAAKVPRRLRRQPVQNTVLRRGHKNKGLIEVWDDEDVTEHTPSLVGKVEETPTGFKATMRTKQNDDAIYRLPARSIQLDFIDFVHAQWRDPWRPTRDSQVLEVLNDLALLPQEEREATRNLAYLQARPSAVDATTAKKNLEQLVDVALDNEANEQALAIRELIKAKGRHRLLEFLSEP